MQPNNVLPGCHFKMLLAGESGASNLISWASRAKFRVLLLELGRVAFALIISLMHDCDL